MSHPKRPDKWDKKARKLWGILIANPFHVLRRDEKAICRLAAALRRTDKAARKKAVHQFLDKYEGERT